MPEEYGILVGVDGSASDAAVRWATREAVLRNELTTFLHVVPPVAATWPPVARRYKRTSPSGKGKTLGMSSSTRARLSSPRWANRRPRCKQTWCIHTLCRP